MPILSCFHLLGPPAPKFTHNVDNDRKDQRLKCFIEDYLDKYDVICLQEMFGAFSRRRRKLIKAAVKRGFHWKVSSPQSRSSMYLVDGGCLILSRVKIVAEASVIFEPGMMSDRLAAKGVIYAKLSPKPGVFVHLFVTHLQAIYAGSDTVADCLAIQKHQYDEVVSFVASTVAANESADDMLQAERLLERKNRKAAPSQDTMRTRRCRRWPVLLAGDFNCNSRPATGDIVTATTPPYADLTHALSKLGDFSDIFFDNLGEHPVTYAAADFDLHGVFSPRETALTSPDDYHESGEYVNQSLDYIFLFPPTYEKLKYLTSDSPMHGGLSPASPDSRAIKSSVVRPVDMKVSHLEYVPKPHMPPNPLKYLSDHMALEAVFDIDATGGSGAHSRSGGLMN